MAKIINYLAFFIGIISSLHAVDVPMRFNDFEQNDFLPNASVKSIFEDSTGILWIGTAKGLARYDGLRLVPFNTQDPIQGVLAEAYILNIKGGQNGDIWFATFGDGLICYKQKTGTYRHFTFDVDDDSSLPSNEVTNVALSTGGDIWASTTNGLVRYVPDNETFVRLQRDAENPQSIIENYLYDIAAAPNGSIWVASSKGVSQVIPQEEGYRISNYDTIFPTESVWRISIDQFGNVWLAFVEKGLGRLDPMTNTFEAFPVPQKQNSTQINHIHTDAYGKLWLSFQRQGLARFDVNTKDYTFFKFDQCRPQSLKSNKVNQTLSAQNGKWWIAHDKGLNYFFPYQKTFQAGRIPAQPGSDDTEFAWPTAIVRAHDKPCYIATDKGIFLKKDGKDDYQNILNLTKLRERSNVKPVHSLMVSSDNHLWIGTHFHGPIRYNIMTGKAEALYVKTGNITQFHEDKEGRIWFTVDGQGLGLWEQGTDGIQFFSPPDSTKSTRRLVRFLCLQPDLNDKGLWMSGVNTGLYYFDLDKKEFTRHLNTASPKRGLEACLDLEIAQDGLVWMATQKGLASIDPKTEKLIYYTTKDGLVDNVITAIELDSQGKIWAGSKNGLSCFNIHKQRFQNFTNRHGLADNAVVKQGFRRQNGEMTLLTSSGVTTFSTSAIGKEKNDQAIVLTGFQVLNEPYGLGSDPALAHDITIQHNDYTFTFFFASPTSASPGQSDFAYQLVGLDEDWINIGKRNFTTFTSLPPDDYVFKVKSMSRPEAKPLEVNLHIVPAFWQTAWFKALLVLLALSLLGVFVWLGKRQLDARQQAALDRQSAQYKSQFLANMSHEIRTPLHAVLGAADLMARTGLSENQGKYVHHIKQSGKHLMGLLDDVLDFSKIEANKLEFNIKDFMLDEVLTYIEETTKPRMQLNGCHFEIQKDANLPSIIQGDPVRLGQILINLLNNAAQFSPEGNIRLDVQLESKKEDAYQIGFRVADDGKGIPQDELAQIFTSFYQASNQPVHQTGAGLGLAITKALVEQHGGTIGVESAIGEGTAFTFSIPFGKPSQTENLQPQAFSGTMPQLNNILMVEDMAVNRELGKDMLEQAFPHARIQMAEDGIYALAILEKDLPELILMDIRMPRMDGLACTRQIRELYGGFLPVLALSASATQDERNRYLQAGIDGLLAKPFTPEQLEIHINELFLHPEGDSLTIDLEKLNYFLGNDEGRVTRYLTNSAQEIEKHIDRLRIDIADGHLGQAQVCAHSLKTSFSYMGVESLVNMAAELEQAMREGKSEVFSPLLPVFVQQVRGFMKINEAHLH
ncbi:MAG: ATP-binding protein [Bacteroidia bacterium]